MRDELESKLEEESEEFLDPITLELIDDPVISPSSGKSFDRKSITAWIRSSGTDPLTREALGVDDLLPNRDLKNAIEAWKRRNSNWQQLLKEMQQIRAELEEKKQLLEKQKVAYQEKEQVYESKTRDQEDEIKKLKNQFTYMMARCSVEKRKVTGAYERECLSNIPRNRYNEAIYRSINQAILAYKKDDLRGAKDIFKTVIKTIGNDPWVQEQLGIIYHQLGNQLNKEKYYNKAIKCYEAIIPPTDESYRRIGWTWYRKAHFKHGDQRQECLNYAFNMYRHSLDMNGENIETHFNLGLCYFVCDDVDNAEREFIQTIKLRPDHCKALVSLGNVLFKKGNLDEAEGFFQQAAKVSPGYYSYTKLGDFYKKKAGRLRIKSLFGLAMQYYEKALADYEDAYVLTQMGYCLTKFGKYERAAELYNRALGLDPTYEQAQYNLKWLHDQQQRQEPSRYFSSSKGFFMSQMGREHTTYRGYHRDQRTNHFQRR